MAESVIAARPDGCWCGGVGGRGFRYIPQEADKDPIQVLSEYCVCPEALSRHAQDDAARAEWKADLRRRSAIKLFAEAEIPPRFEHCSFDTYPVSGSTRAALKTVRGWWETADEKKESLLLYGPYGTGKTGLAVSVIREVVQSGATDVLFITTPALLDRIRQTYSPRRSRDGNEPDEADVLEAVRDATLLVLDDLGAERPTDWVQEKLFSIINHRHDQMLSTIFTSNLDPEGLAKHLGERIAWRIVEMCEVVKLNGPNLRDRR